MEFFKQQIRDRNTQTVYDCGNNVGIMQTNDIQSGTIFLAFFENFGKRSSNPLEDQIRVRWMHKNIHAICQNAILLLKQNNQAYHTIRFDAFPKKTLDYLIKEKNLLINNNVSIRQGKTNLLGYELILYKDRYDEFRVNVPKLDTNRFNLKKLEKRDINSVMKLMAKNNIDAKNYYLRCIESKLLPCYGIYDINHNFKLIAYVFTHFESFKLGPFKVDPKYRKLGLGHILFDQIVFDVFYNNPNLHQTAGYITCATPINNIAFLKLTGLKLGFCVKRLVHRFDVGLDTLKHSKL